MSSAPEETFFRHGRINALDLARQHPDFVLDYATRYDIPNDLSSNEIVRRIFKGGQEFIPILPNHTWALEDNYVVLTERKEPPNHPHYLAPASSTTESDSLGHAFPQVPKDTYSRSPSPASHHDVDPPLIPPLQLPLAYPTVGLPFAVDAGNRPEGKQPVPDDWLERILEKYEEYHHTVNAELKGLTEETKNVSADVVRVLSKIKQERADTRRIIDAVRNICGQELLDSVMKDVYSTTNFEMSKKQNTPGYTYQSVVYSEGGKEGGTIRSKKKTSNKHIFTAEGGASAFRNQSEDLPVPLGEPHPDRLSDSGPSSSTDVPDVPKIPTKEGKKKSPGAIAVAPVPLETSGNSDSATATTSGLNALIKKNKGKKRTYLSASDDDTSAIVFDEQASRFKRQKPSIALAEPMTSAQPTPAAGPSTASTTSASVAPSTSTRFPVDTPNTQGRSGGTPSDRGGVQDGNTVTAEPVLAPAFILQGRDLSSLRPRLRGPSSLNTPQSEHAPLSQPDSAATSTFPAHNVIPQSQQTSSSSGSSHSAAGSSQLTSEAGDADPTRPSCTAIKPRRAAPLARDYERIFINPNGTLEARDYRTPQYMEAMAALESDIQREMEATYPLVYSSIINRCEQRYPVLFEGKDKQLHKVYPPK